jgi:hypothetical protein
MSDFQAIADRVEIEALRGEFTDAAMVRARARLASLFTPDGPCGSKTAPSKHAVLGSVGTMEVSSYVQHRNGMIDPRQNLTSSSRSRSDTRGLQQQEGRGHLTWGSQLRAAATWRLAGLPNDADPAVRPTPTEASRFSQVTVPADD